MSRQTRSTSDDQSSSGEEARPPHTSEIGTLKKLPNHGTEWLGSSSGVFFVNTVRRAFSAAFRASESDTESLPAAEDILAGGEVGNSSKIGGGGINEFIAEAPSTSSGIEQTLAAALGRPPDRNIATALVLGFFKAWHPLFPFLHGPTFLKDMEDLYCEKRSENAHEAICKAVTFQVVINIASLDQSNISLPVESRIKSIADVTRCAGVLSSRHNIETIQALLAAKLFLVAIMALREASTVGGVLLRSLFHAGLHRCPLRYAQLSPEDCKIRKRIFWSAYALDRHLTQSLGYPITLQDNDIDTCLSGTRELHHKVARESLNKPGEEIRWHMPEQAGPGEGMLYDNNHNSETMDGDSPSRTLEKVRREAALTFYVQYSRLTGRAIEIYHKSINYRFAKREAITSLVSDIEAWWNDLPGFLSGEDVTEIPSHQQILSPFFNILYAQLMILMNRPSLSLDPASADFQHGLQRCIRASRGVLSALKSHRSHGQTMFWPGLLSANWMAGLIIAFACLLGKYPVRRASSDINTCLDLLQAMNARWNTARQCHLVLSSLLGDIQNRRTSVTGYVSLRKEEPDRDEVNSNKDSEGPSTKRQRKSLSRTSPPSVPLVANPSSETRAPAHQLHPSESSNADTPNNRYPTIPADHFATTSFSHIGPSQWANLPNTSFMTYQPSNMEHYSYPDGQAYQASQLGLSNLPTNESDSQYTNLQYNMADVFESATWERLVGSAGQLGPGWEA